MPMSAGLAATLEKPKTVGAQVFLGPTVIGPNYKVKPQARSDGMMRLFTVETPYGEFQFDGVEFAEMRLRELDAVAALEKMSQSDRFMSALGRAAFAPVKFGADLIDHQPHRYHQPFDERDGIAEHVRPRRRRPRQYPRRPR